MLDKDLDDIADRCRHDIDLFKKYDLSPEEVNYIESMIKAM